MKTFWLRESEVERGTPTRLSDPRNRNHKALAIGNHNFEVASFSRGNRNKSQCHNHKNRIGPPKSRRFRITALCSQRMLGRFQTFVALQKHSKRPHKTGGSRVQRVGFRACFRSRSEFFELQLQSLAICVFIVAAIRVTKRHLRA